MTEKRKFPRFACNIKAKFEYYEGNPEDIDLDISIPVKAKGHILDVSKGGLFLVSDEKVAIGLPIRVIFSTKKNNFSVLGIIVRTGLLENNPSELAVKFSRFSAKGDSYIAVEFDDILDNLTEEEL